MFLLLFTNCSRKKKKTVLPGVLKSRNNDFKLLGAKIGDEKVKFDEKSEHLQDTVFIDTRDAIVYFSSCLRTPQWGVI